MFWWSTIFCSYDSFHLLIRDTIFGVPKVTSIPDSLYNFAHKVGLSPWFRKNGSRSPRNSIRRYPLRSLHGAHHSVLPTPTNIPLVCLQITNRTTRRNRNLCRYNILLLLTTRMGNRSWYLLFMQFVLAYSFWPPIQLQCYWFFVPLFTALCNNIIFLYYAIYTLS